jgi:hypothetical protein
MVLKVGRVVQNQAIGLAIMQSQPAPDDLLQEANAFGLAKDGNQIDVACIEARGQH